MNTIQTFLENMFAGLPKTAEILKAKEDLHQMMMEKYEDYKKEGKSENEAVGLVISEFGNIDELLVELGIQVEKEAVVQIDDQQADAFIASRQTHSWRIALGVLLCIAGPAFLISSSHLTQWLGINVHQDLLGGILLFAMIIPAIGIFIGSGMELSQAGRFREAAFELTSQARHQMELAAEGYQKTYQRGILSGVMIILMSMLFFITSGFIGNAQTPFVSLGLLVVGAGVFRLIWSGVIMSGYNQLLKRGSHTPAMQKANRLTDIVASIVFPLTAVVYLLVSFLTMRWDITWIMWPVVGICFGIFAGATEEIHKHKK